MHFMDRGLAMRCVRASILTREMQSRLTYRPRDTLHGGAAQRHEPVIYMKQRKRGKNKLAGKYYTFVMFIRAACSALRIPFQKCVSVNAVG
jgi:hypothetical protein